MATAIVIGAGIIGSSIAWRLSARGWQVTLLERGAIGAEASWAGAGMLAPGGENEADTPWLDLALESLRLYPEYTAELSEESGYPIDFQRAGAIEMALTEEEAAALEARAARQASLGIPSEPMTTSSRYPHGMITPYHARFYPQDALVDPRDIMKALRAVLEQRGVAVREYTPVQAVSVAGGVASITTGHGTLTADVAVLAAGAWSSSIPVEIDGTQLATPASYPVRGHLLGYLMPPGAFRHIVRHQHTYLLQRSRGYLVAGTSTENVGFDRNVNPQTVQEIAARAAHLWPELGGQTKPDAWVGFRPGTERKHPAIERPAAALWLAYGHYRNGILLAPATAERVAAGM